MGQLRTNPASGQCGTRTPRLPDCESDALTTRPRCLPFKMHSKSTILVWKAGQTKNFCGWEPKGLSNKIMVNQEMLLLHLVLTYCCSLCITYSPFTRRKVYKLNSSVTESHDPLKFLSSPKSYTLVMKSG